MSADILDIYKSIYPANHKIKEIILEKGIVKKYPKFHHNRIDGGEFKEPKACYRNAYQYCKIHPRAIYYEGFYMTEAIPIPLEHAWCVIDGKIFDPTCDEKQHKNQYLGVAVSLKRVEEAMLETGYYGYFCNYWLHGKYKLK